MTTSNPYELKLAGELVDGRYRIEKLIGHGGMGTVWLAKDERVDGRAVVVKVPRASFLEQEGFLDRFEREIKSLTRLDHPRIVKVLDIARVQGIPCVVLQYLGGGSLAERTETVVTPEDVVPWITPVAEALDFIHSQGVIHRDVKPGNILFDGYGNAFLADFGIAKALGGEETGLTQSGASPGSPSFMAPEAGAPDALGPRYDQYSLAVVVYKALSGRLPHEGRTALEVIMKRNVDPPHPLRQAAPNVSAAVERVVMKALSRAPNDRYVSCRAFAGDFVTAVGTSVSVATPRSDFTRNVTAILPGGTKGGGSGGSGRKIAIAVGALVLIGAAIFGWSRLHPGADSSEKSPTSQADASDHAKDASAAKPAPDPEERFTFDQPKENAATDRSELEITGTVTPATTEKIVIGLEKGPVTTVAIGKDGAVKAKLAAPTQDGRVTLVAWTLDRRELARRNIDIDRTPPTVSAHVKETRPLRSDERTCAVQFDASEPVTLLDESGKTELAQLAAGKGEVALPLPEGAPAEPQKRTVRLQARDRGGHSTKVEFEVEIYDVELRVGELVARRPRLPDGFAALRGAALVTASAQAESAALAWEKSVAADPLLGARRDELTKAADWQAQRAAIKTAKESASKVTVHIDAPADGSATNAAEVVVRGRADPPGTTLQIAVARRPAQEVVAGADGAFEVKFALPDKDGPCHIEVKGGAAGTAGAGGPVLAQLDLVVDRAIALNKEPSYDPDVTRASVDRDVIDHVTAQLDFGEAVTLTRLDPVSGEPVAGAAPVALANGKGDFVLPLPATTGAERSKVTLAFRVEDALKNQKEFRREVEIFSGKLANAGLSEENLKRIADWADVVRADPDPAQIADAKVRARIAATALPWLVRHRQTGIEMVLVPPGEYLMGSMVSELERPVHRVKLTRAFYVGRCEVTQGEWSKVVAANPSKFQGDPNLPVETISFTELTRSGGFLQQTGLRLPTEAEWEYVAHGLNETKYPWGENDDPDCMNVAASGKDAKALEQTAKVGSYPKGMSWCGAYDLAGNVWEWCNDWYDATSYNARVQPVVDPTGPANATMRVIRGGAFNYSSRDARCASRGKLSPADHFNYVGFRVVKVP